MSQPNITIDLKKIEENARSISELCNQHNISITGVTKVTCGMPEVAAAMLKGGVKAIGETRFDNIRRIKAKGIDCPIMLLRTPHISAVEDVVQLADISFNSELAVIKELSKAAVKQNKTHKILLMVELGDLREGICQQDLIPTVEEVLKLPNIKLAGIGTNLTCFGGIIPTEDNLGNLVKLADEIESKFNIQLEIISGGNSSSLKLLAAGKLPAKINHLRIGEAIVLGRETTNREIWPGTSQDAFIISAEIIELKEKSSVPTGIIGQDAFGNVPEFEDKGMMKRAILNIGRQDVNIEGITPLDTSIEILGASSDHLLTDVTKANKALKPGDILQFEVNYAALLAAMTSGYVDKRTIN